ncbi:hypothetical protein BG32_09420, partial [Mesotoga sp. HF07.pep.5.2.highcov]
PYDGDIDFEIPSLILALSRATGSRSSTVVEGVQITALHMDNLKEKCYLIVVGEFLEDNSYRLLKTIVESYEVEL